LALNGLEASAILGLMSRAKRTSSDLAPTLEPLFRKPNLEPRMARPRQRACLQDGLTLDLNRLARKGFVRRGANIGVQVITWTHSYWGEIATGMISADISGPHEGWFRIQLGSLD